MRVTTFFVGRLCPKGYIFHHTPRENSRGGGIGIQVKKLVRVKKLCSVKFGVFENVVTLAEYPIRSIRFIVIYRPPLLQIKAFLEDFAILFEQLVPLSGNLLIVGDFNFHECTVQGLEVFHCLTRKSLIYQR